MFRQLALAVFVSAAMLVGALVVVVKSDSGGDRICAVATAVLQDVSGLPVAAECHVDPIATRVTIQNVRLGPASAPIFEAERISASIDQKGFLSGKIRVDHVEVVHPRISLDLSQAGSGSGRAGEARPPGAACLPDLGHLELGVANLKDGDVTIALPDGRHFNAKGMAVELQGSGEKLSVKFTAASSTLSDPAGSTGADRVQLRGEFDLNAGTAKLDSVDVSGAVGSVFAQGELSSICHLRGQASATVHANLDRLHDHLLASVDNLSGSASLDARVNFDGSQFDATAEAQVRDSRVLGFAPGSFSGSFHATPQALEVTRFELPLDSGKLIADARLTLAPPFELTAAANLDNLVLGELLERLGLPELPVQLRASGTATVAGPVVGPQGPALDVDLKAKVPEFGVFDRSFRRRQEAHAERYVALHKGAIEGRFRIGQTRIVVSQAVVSTSDTQATFSGDINFDPKRGLRLQLDSKRVRLDELGPFGPAVCSGIGDIHGTLAGPYDALVLDTTARVRRLSVQEFDIGDVSARTHLDLGQEVLDITGARGTHGASSFSGDGHLSFKGDTPLDGRLSLDGARLADLLDIAAGRFAALDKLDGNVNALVTGDVELSGPTSELNLDARLALSQVELYGQRFETGTVRTTLHRGEELRVSTLELNRGQARVHGRGQLEIEDGSYKMDLVTRGLHVAQLDAIAARVPNSRGTVSLRLSGFGTLEHPQAKGKLIVRDWRSGDQPIATAQLDLGLEDTAARIDGTLTSPWPTDLTPLPHEPGTPFPSAPDSMLHVVHATIDLAGDMPFTAQANLSIPDARALAPRDALGELRGGLQGTLQATGNLEAPDQLDAQLELTQLWMKHKGTRLESDHATVVRLSHGRLVLNPVVLRSPFFEVRASGVREADGRLQFQAQGDLDLALLRDEVPEAIDVASGTLGLRLELTGTQARPAFVGTAEIENIALHLVGLPLWLTDGSGTVAFGKSGIQLEKVTAKLNNGPMSVSGNLALDSGYIPGQFDFEANFGNVPFRWEDTEMIIAGKPTLSGNAANLGNLRALRIDPENRITLGGDMQLVKLHFTQDLELERTALEAVELSRRPPTPQLTLRSFGEFLNLKLGISLGDVRIDNNLFKAQLRGELKLEGTNRHPGLTGTVSVQDGKAYVRNNEFSVSSAIVTFTDPNGFRPNFDASADSQVHDYLVHMHATGTPQNPVVIMTAEPALTQADIVMLLTTGVTSKDFAGTGALSGVALEAAYNATGIPEQMKRLLPKNDVLRDAQFGVASGYNPSTQATEPLAEFHAKVLRDDWSLQGQTSLLGHPGANKADGLPAAQERERVRAVER
jgi:translocation and assembly module TamB